MKLILLLFLCFVLIGCNSSVNFKERKLNLAGIGYSGCVHCGDKWNWKQHHTVNYSESSGMFPLCEECFNKLTFETCLEYYVLQFNKWEHSPTNKELETLCRNIADEKNSCSWTPQLIREKFKIGKERV